jgi:hypothetical protein
VSVETFANVSALETLDLSNNNLRSVDINTLKALPQLSALHLFDNPLECDCQLQAVWQWCEEHNIRFFKAKCPRLEELQCVQENISNTEEHKQEYNKHQRDEYVSYFAMFLILIILYLFLSIFGTIGNVILLIIIICNKDMRTVPNMYILNLAISDLIFLTLPIADVTVIILDRVKFDQELWCTFLPFFYRMSVGLSAYSMVVLSIQRYRLIVNPFHVRVSSQPAWRISVSTICGVWIVAALFAIPSALSKFTCIDNYYAARRFAYHKRVFTFKLFVFCVLPLFVVAFFYVMTAHHLVKSADVISEETQNPQLNKRKNVAKYVLALSVVFVISYVPYHAFWAYIYFNRDLEFEMFDLNFADLVNTFPLPVLISYCFFLMNSSLNPVALFCTSFAFRKHYKRYLCCCCKAKSPPTDTELRRIN